MNKTQLIREMAEQNTISIREAKKMVNMVLGAIGDALKDDEDLIIPDFGRFYIKTLRERQGKKPNTKEPITIPARKTIRFKAYRRIKSYSIIN